MNKTVYALVIVRRYKNIGDTTSVLIYDTKDKAEEQAKHSAETLASAKEIQTAIIEMSLSGGGDQIEPFILPTQYGVKLSSTNTQ
jgi:hypothetical protein